MTVRIKELEKNYAEDVRYLNDEIDRMKEEMDANKAKDESLLNGLRNE